MDGTERDHTAMHARRSGKHGGASKLLKLGALLVLVLLMADLLTRQIALLADSAGEPSPGRAKASFLKVQVGDFRAEIRWNDNSNQE